MVRLQSASDALLVLSARRGMFWQLEGDARSRRGQVIAHPLDRAQLYHVALGHVLAVTHRAQDDSLYVLDEVARGHGWRRRSQARLLRISTDGAGSLEVLARDAPLVEHALRAARRTGRCAVAGGVARARRLPTAG